MRILKQEFYHLKSPLIYRNGRQLVWIIHRMCRGNEALMFNGVLTDVVFVGAWEAWRKHRGEEASEHKKRKALDSTPFPSLPIVCSNEGWRYKRAWTKNSALGKLKDNFYIKAPVTQILGLCGPGAQRSFLASGLRLDFRVLHTTTTTITTTAVKHTANAIAAARGKSSEVESWSSSLISSFITVLLFVLVNKYGFSWKHKVTK